MSDREDWARERRTWYGHDGINDHPCPASRKLANYADAGESAAAMSALRRMLRADPGNEALAEPLRDMRRGKAPWRWISKHSCPAAVQTILTRFQTAQTQADAEWRRRVEATPIDDEAWAAELEQRRCYEGRYGHS